MVFRIARAIRVTGLPELYDALSGSIGRQAVWTMGFQQPEGLREVHGGSFGTAFDVTQLVWLFVCEPSMRVFDFGPASC